MIVADTSVWIGFFNGVPSPGTGHLRKSLEEASVLLGDLILTEILQGFRSDRDYRTVRERLSALDVVNLGGRDIALAAADNYRILRVKGVTVRKTVAMIIGTYCIRNDLPLLHNDRDFDPMERYLGLKVAR